MVLFFFFSSRRRHTRYWRDWSSDVCSSDLIIGHAVTKAALFLCAGDIIKDTGYKDLTMLKGVGRKLPYTLALFFIASLSMIGIPLLPGFISKWYLSLESIQAKIGRAHV